MDKKILVTGGAGYIGSALVPKLLEKGYGVRIFDSLVFGDIGLAGVRDKIELVQGDIRNAPADLMDGIWGVIHLAGMSAEPVSYFNPRYTDLVNHIGTENIARLAKVAGIERFIFASSCAVYFTYDTPHIPPFYKEDERVNSISPYALAKRASEEALAELADANFRPTILRKGTLYGYSPKMRYDLVLNSFTKNAFLSDKLTIHASGDIYRPMCDLQDAVATYVAALELPIERVGGKIFNVCHANWRLGDMADDFRKIIKDIAGKDIEVEVKQMGVTRNYRADNAKYLAAFGLAPLRTVHDAIAELWDKVQQEKDVNNPLYYTDGWYQKLMIGKIANLA
jgi:nucleoside-diphosphate-sugar epimerase